MHEESSEDMAASDADSSKPDVEQEAFLPAAGDMGARVRLFDWTQTPLGPAEGWTAALRSALSICLGSPFPIALYWGPSLTLIYNDAWSPILGSKHPWALGRPAHEVWPEIWDAIGPMFERVLSSGTGTYSEDALLEMNRHGYVEECYFNFTFTPVRNDAGIEGVFNAVIETTYRVISERRNEVLRNLSNSMASARSAADACRHAADSLGEASRVVPFCEVYLLEDDARPVLVGRSGLPDNLAPYPADAALRDDYGGRWPLAKAAASGRVERVEQLFERLGIRPPGGAWPEPSPMALLAPFKVTGRIRGYLLLGVNPRRAVDREYEQFAERAAALIATAVANADAYEAERKRAEALAEIDRAKSTFFSNISHEFRTPLTLMIGPVETALQSTEAALTGEDLRAVHRNALRLLKLVNALLDFSRLEAGGVVIRPEPTDIAALTRDLASAFRSTIERAGLKLTVECPPLPGRMQVDRDIWEKVVLNLLSNAFKFTHAGEIVVRLRVAANALVLQVSDTGVGIAQDELDNVFKRFHRVHGAGVRSHEGSGIGLALISELVKLHGGEISVQSRVGEGSTFTVRLPAQLAAQELASHADVAADSGRSAAMFVSEVARWSTHDPQDPYAGEQALQSPASSSSERILIIDDNADMRDYVTRLLGSRWPIEAVADGAQAIERARLDPPSLVLTDVMLPGVDGFEVLRALRADARTQHVPIIMLSARAGEESRVEGLRAGADDYLVKPFAANELIVRVDAQLQHARAKQATERERRRLHSLLSQVPAIVNFLRGPDLVLEYVHPRAIQVLGGRDVLGKPLLEAVPEMAGQEFPALMREVFETGRRIEGREQVVQHLVEGEIRTGYWDYVYLPVFGDDARPEGVMTFDIEVTDQVHARLEARSAREKLESAIAAAGVGTFRVDTSNMMAARDAQLNLILGLEARDSVAPVADMFARVHEQDRAAVDEAWRQVLAATESKLELECRIHRPDGRARWTRLLGRVVEDDAEQRIVTGALIDITERREAELRFREMADAAPSILRVSDRSGVCTFLSRGWEDLTGQSRADALGSGWIEMVHPEDRALVQQRIVAASAAQTAFSIDYRVRSPDGSFRWAVDAGRPWFSDDGEFLGHVGAVFDIADRKELERQALEANRAKDEFLAMLGHELRNPLSPIVTALQLIRLRGSRDAPEIEVIERQVTHLIRLVDDLLDVSRIARGKIELKLERVELADLVARGIETASPLLEQRRQLLVCSVPTDGLAVDVDGARIAQVLANLLTNASKYSDPGTKIEVSAEASSDLVTLRIKDQGIGIEPEMLSSVFELFVQQPQSIDRAKGGLGLGLAIVRSLVELHGGSVKALSEGLGRGSEFVVSLPLALGSPRVAGGAARAVATASVEPRERSGTRVLVVDDNEDAADLVAELLGALGHETAVAHDGPAALALAATFKPHVCLLDIGLPVMDGYELAARLRAAQGLPDGLRIVALTGYGTQNDKQRALDAGFDEHLVKPVEFEALKRIVRGR